MKYTKETLIGEVLDNDGSLGKYFMDMGMHCLGCPAARGECIEEACQVHGLDVDRVLYTNLSIGKIGGLKDGTNQPVVLY